MRDGLSAYAPVRYQDGLDAPHGIGAQSAFEHYCANDRVNRMVGAELRALIETDDKEHRVSCPPIDFRCGVGQVRPNVRRRKTPQGVREYQFEDAHEMRLFQPSIEGMQNIALYYREKYGVTIVTAPDYAFNVQLIKQLFKKHDGDFKVGVVAIDNDYEHASPWIVGRYNGHQYVVFLDSAPQHFPHKLMRVCHRKWDTYMPHSGRQADQYSCHADALSVLKEGLRSGGEPFHELSKRRYYRRLFSQWGDVMCSVCPFLFGAEPAAETKKHWARLFQIYPFCVDSAYVSGEHYRDCVELRPSMLRGVQRTRYLDRSRALLGNEKWRDIMDAPLAHGAQTLSHALDGAREEAVMREYKVTDEGEGRETLQYLSRFPVSLNTFVAKKSQRYFGLAWAVKQTLDKLDQAVVADARRSVTLDGYLNGI